MNKNKINMLIVWSLLLFFLAQALAWLQINGQFVWPWMKDHKMLISFIGVPISYLLMLATDYAYVGMDNKIWPGRFMAFAVGMLVFTVFTSVFLGQGINFKVCISLVLSAALLIIQML
jgi:hypothetical protein